MKITISGSITFYSQMQELKAQLTLLGHDAYAPTADNSTHGKTVSIEEKTMLMREHLEKIEWADCLVVFNCIKKDIEGYIGPNTLLEMGVAFYLHKKIYLMYQIPEVAYKDEVAGMEPILINGDITQIN